MVLALTLAVGGIGLWEWEMRGLGLEPGDLGDGQSHWADERRRVGSDEDPVVIVGASRILFATDLAGFERISGHRPTQLALPGTNARPILADLADDEDFAGLVIVGITETSFFRDGTGLFGGVLDYYREQSPSQRVGHRLHLALSRIFAFIDDSYGLLRLVERIRLAEREGVRGPYDDVWKLSVSGDGRQTWMWRRIETDTWLREHARHAWDDFRGDPIPSSMVDAVIESTRADIDRIRARGGDVVFLRPPSDGPVRVNEKLRAPRTRVWDRLVLGTDTVGIHFEDFPAMTGLDQPEWSHLTRESAQRFTEAYVNVMIESVDWFGGRNGED
jgi:hypothetical protein